MCVEGSIIPAPGGAALHPVSPSGAQPGLDLSPPWGPTVALPLPHLCSSHLLIFCCQCQGQALKVKTSLYCDMVSRYKIGEDADPAIVPQSINFLPLQWGAHRACWGESWRAGKAQVLQASNTLPFCSFVTPLFLLGAERHCKGACLGTVLAVRGPDLPSALRRVLQ